MFWELYRPSYSDELNILLTFQSGRNKIIDKYNYSQSQKMLLKEPTEILCSVYQI
jgi:hypothetical protein